MRGVSGHTLGGRELRAVKLLTSGSYNGLVKALYALALLVFLIALPPVLWPGAFLFVLAWAFWPKGRVYLAWGAYVFSLYLFAGASAHDLEALQQRAVLAGELTVGLWAFAYSASLAAGRSRWAPLPFMLWAFFMKPGGAVLAVFLLAWVGWNYVLSRDLSKEFGVGFSVSRRAALATLAGVVVLAGGALLVGNFAYPAARAPQQVEAGSAPRQVAAAKPPLQPAAAGRPTGSRLQRSARQELPRWAEKVYAAYLVLGGLGVLVLLALMALLWLRVLQTRVERRGFDRRSALLVLLSLTTLIVGVVWFALVFHGEGGGLYGGGGLAVAGRGVFAAGGAEAVSQTAGRSPLPVATLLVLGIVGMLLMLGVFIYVASRLLQAPPAAEAVVEETRGERSPVFAGRVRAAYRQFMRLMLPYAPMSRSETPREYAARLGRRYEGLQGAVEELTNLYEPVRYGGLADELEAGRAEALVKEIAAELEKGSEAG